MNISQNINDFLGKRNPEDRYASFDYCFNYFRSFFENDRTKALMAPDRLELSCLQIGFYLASWGMFRGSTFLLGKSANHFKGLIIELANLDKRLWNIDLDLYSGSNIDLLLEARDSIRDCLGNKNDYATDTLVSKIMLGVYGNVPAFDQFFCTGSGIGKSMNKKNLLAVKDFYQKHRNQIDKFNIRTIDFKSGQETHRYYTKAKVIDMIGFMEGIRIIG